MECLIDLHTHSTVSDGACSPSEVVKAAYKNNVKILALTDHDSIAGIKEAQNESEKYGIKLINGIEVSALYKGNRMLHILGLGIDITNKEFLNSYYKMKKAREATMTKVLKCIRNNNKINISIDNLSIGKLDEFLSRHDIHRYMLDNKICDNSKEIWVKYLNQIEYEKDELIPIDETINMIHKAGGLAFLAHYNNKEIGLGEFNQSEIEEHIKYLISLGLDGVERYYPRFTKDDEKFIESLVKKYNLLSCGGTDYHGNHRPNNDIGIGDGNFSVPYEIALLI